MTKVYEYRVRLDSDPILSARDHEGSDTVTLASDTAGRLGEILAAAHAGDQLDRFMSSPEEARASIRRSFAEGWEIGANDVLNELRGFEGTEAIGRVVWGAWYAGMVVQARYVARERQDWDILDARDRSLDTGIGTIVVQRLANLAEQNARASRSMREDADDSLDGIGAFVAQAQPGDGTERYAEIQAAWDAKFPPHMNEKTDIMGKPTTAEGIATLDRDVPGDILADALATIERMHGRYKKLRRKSRERTRRLAQQIEIRDNQIAYHKERSVNVTARLEQAQEVVIKLQEDAVTALTDLSAAFNVERGRIEVERDDWQRRYEEVAATLETVIAERDTESRTIEQLRADAIARAAEIDTLRSELVQARAVKAGIPEGAIGEFFGRALAIAGSEQASEGLTVQLLGIQGEVKAVNDLIRRSGEDNRIEIARRLAIVAARACRIHQLRGKADGPIEWPGNPPPAFVLARPDTSLALPSGLPRRIPSRDDLIVYALQDHDGHWKIYRDTYRAGYYAIAQQEPTRVMPDTAEAIRRIMLNPALLNDLYHLPDLFLVNLHDRNLTNYRIEVGREIGEIGEIDPDRNWDTDNPNGEIVYDPAPVGRPRDDD